MRKHGPVCSCPLCIEQYGPIKPPEGRCRSVAKKTPKGGSQGSPDTALF